MGQEHAEVGVTALGDATEAVSARAIATNTARKSGGGISSGVVSSVSRSWRLLARHRPLGRARADEVDRLERDRSRSSLPSPEV